MVATNGPWQIDPLYRGGHCVGEILTYVSPRVDQDEQQPGGEQEGNSSPRSGGRERLERRAAILLWCEAGVSPGDLDPPHLLSDAEK